MNNGPSSLTADCGDGCGWLAAIVATVAYGSFGVPIKGTRVQDVHPWVWQSYKTVVVFASSPLVITLIAHQWGFTPWGLVSGTLWTCGGFAGVHGIKHAGLAVAVGTWSTVMVAVNFAWGFGVFREPIHDIVSVLICLVGLATGLIGMSYYAAPPATQTTKNVEARDQEDMTSSDDEESNQLVNALLHRQESNEIFHGVELRARTRNDEDSSENAEDTNNSGAEAEDLLATKKPVADTVRLFGREVSARTSGVLAAALNGVFTGSSLLPIRYAKQNGFGGANYFFSFATGALLSNLVGWLLFWGWLSYCQEWDWKVAWRSLPSWHVSKLARGGILCGALLTVGMVGSMISITHLGQGLGNSVIQTKIIVSGLWGIFGFGEIIGSGRIAKWMVSAVLAVFSILWLSAQRRWASAAALVPDANETMVPVAMNNA